jgi:hypothetical protein
MKKTNKSKNQTLLIFLILIGIFSLTINNISFAKKRNMERLKTMKKVRLLEYLDLNPAKSDKFLVKFNEYEQKHENISMEIRSNIDELRVVLEENPSKNTSIIKDNVSKLNKLHNDMMKLSQDEDNDMKTLLDEVEYAKYIVFKMGFRDMAMEKLEEYREKMRGGDDNSKRGAKRGW